MLNKIKYWLNDSFKTWACGKNVLTVVKSGDWYTEIITLANGGLQNIQVRKVTVRIGREGGAIFNSEYYLVAALELKNGPILFNGTAQHLYDTMVKFSERVKRLNESLSKFIKETERTTVEI